MKKLTQTVLVSLLAAVFILFSAGCPNDAPDTNGVARTIDTNRSGDLSQRDAKIYSKATVADDFDDSSLIVILDNFTGEVNKKHKESFFGGFKKEYVQDLTIMTDSFEKIDKESFRQIFEIKLPKEVAGKEQVLKAIRELEKTEGILYAGPNYYYYAAKTPDDYLYNVGGQWALNGYYGIQAEAAWEITTGSPNVKVGIIDTGIANHPDLEANVSRTLGKNFINNSQSATYDTDGHGTHVAGIVGAIGNNDTGISGVCWNVTLVPLKINDTSLGDPATISARIIQAIYHAKDKGIKILNISWGSNYDDPVLNNIIETYCNEILFICAAGDDGKENTYSLPIYPSNYNNRINLISVGSIDYTSNISGFSNYSYQYVDIFAPGGSNFPDIPEYDILSTYPCAPYVCTKPGHYRDGYHYMAGTSMATPHVTGVAALMLSANSTLTPFQIKEIIKNNVDRGGRLECTSGGRLNAFKALKACVTTVNIKAVPLAAPVIGATPVETVETAQYTGTVTWNPNHTTFARGTQYTATINLTPKSGYTFYGVTANYFTVTGATSVTNAANTGAVTAAFPLIIAPVTVTVGTPSRTLSPIDTTATVNVTVNGLSGNDTVSIGLATNSYGITLTGNTTVGASGKTLTLSYNGATVTQTNPVSIGLTISSSYYSFSGSPSVNPTIADGQASNRAIPVTQANIAAFNSYANTAAGLSRPYKLAGNVMLTGSNNWTAIGTTAAPFTGTFDGQGYAITNLSINNATSNYQGMFSVIGGGGVVKDLGLVNVSITNNANVGGLAGENYGVIQNCYTTGTVRSTDINIGGLVGVNRGEVVNCYSTANVEAKGNVGGIAGDNFNGILNCYTTGNVKSSDLGFAGGVAGNNSKGLIQNCYATGNVSGGVDSSNVGGVVGRNSYTIQNTVALNPAVCAKWKLVGRISGEMSGGLTCNYARNAMEVYTYSNGVEVEKKINPGLNTEDGEGITPTQWNSASWWTNAANWYTAYGFPPWDTKYWDIADGRLPILKNMPKGVQNPVIQYMPDAVNVTVSVGIPILALSPLNTTATVKVKVSGLSGSDTVSIELAENSYGITLTGNTTVGASGETLTLSYNGTTVTQTSPVSIGLTLDHVRYILSGSPSVNPTIADGQASNRAIPVTRANIAAFNSYANTATGRARHYKLAGNVTLTGSNNWTAIGTTAAPFTGTFDGQGHTITNLSIDNTTGNYQGMFGVIGGGVKNLGLVNVSITSNANVGGLVGENYGAIQNCYTTGTVRSTDINTGGLVGVNRGEVVSCYSTANVEAKGNVGGIAGDNFNGILNCYTMGNVKSSDLGFAGGVVGNNSKGLIQNCYATGSVSGGVDSSNAGGVVGRNSYTIQNTVALNPAVCAKWKLVGRISGEMSGEFKDNYARNSMSVYIYPKGVEEEKKINPGPATEDGADITQTKWNSASWWTKANWDKKYWDIVDGRLPILKNMPTGVQNPVIQYMPDAVNVTVSVGIPTLALSPLNTTATVKVKVSGLSGSDTVSIELAENSYGITLTGNTTVGASGGTLTLSYNGATVTQTGPVSIGLTMDHVRYILSGSPSVNPTIADGQASNRAIPVTQANIAAFNSYANTATGLPRHYKLAGNVTLTGSNNWTPIGTNGKQFTGTFDGQGFIITNLSIDNTTDNYQGMFGVIGGGVKNLGLVNVSITGYSKNVGGLAGENYGAIQNCYTTGAVRSTDINIGGLVGMNCGEVVSCYSTANVEAKGNVGGIAGDNFNGILNCYTTGNVKSSDLGFAGGVAGNNSKGLIQNCYATGSVSGGVDSINAGGVVGRNSYTIQNTVALNPAVCAKWKLVGRISGEMSGGLKDNYARNSMSVTYSNGVEEKKINPGLNTEDGADITQTQWNSASWWTKQANWDKKYWDIVDGRLPILNNMPTGVQNPEVQ